MPCGVSAAVAGLFGSTRFVAPPVIVRCTVGAVMVATVESRPPSTSVMKYGNESVPLMYWSENGCVLSVTVLPAMGPEAILGEGVSWKSLAL